MSPVCRMVSFWTGPPAPAAPLVPAAPAPPPAPAAPGAPPAPALPPAGLLTPQPAALAAHAPASEAAKSARNVQEVRRAGRRGSSAPRPAPVSRLAGDVPRVAPCQLIISYPFLEVGISRHPGSPRRAPRTIGERSLAKIIPFRRLRECGLSMKSHSWKEDCSKAASFTGSARDENLPALEQRGGRYRPMRSNGSRWGTTPVSRRSDSAWAPSTRATRSAPARRPGSAPSIAP